MSVQDMGGATERPLPEREPLAARTAEAVAPDKLGAPKAVNPALRRLMTKPPSDELVGRRTSASKPFIHTEPRARSSVDGQLALHAPVGVLGSMSSRTHAPSTPSPLQRPASAPVPPVPESLASMLAPLGQESATSTATLSKDVATASVELSSSASLAIFKPITVIDNPLLDPAPFIEAHSDVLPAEYGDLQYVSPRAAVRAVIPLIARVELERDVDPVSRKQLVELTHQLHGRPWVAVVPNMAAKSDTWFTLRAVSTMASGDKPMAVLPISEVEAFLRSHSEVHDLVRMDHATFSGTQMVNSLRGGGTDWWQGIRQVYRRVHEGTMPRIFVVTPHATNVARRRIEEARAIVLDGAAMKTLPTLLRETYGQDEGMRILNTLARMYPEVGEASGEALIRFRGITLTYFDIKIPDQLSTLSPMLRDGAVRGMDGKPSASPVPLVKNADAPAAYRLSTIFRSV